MFTEGVAQLLSRPLRRGMRSDVEVNNSPPVVRKEDQHVEQAEGDGRNDKEVNGNDLCGMILQERFPALLGCLRRFPRHVPLHGGLGNTHPQFQEFAMNPRRSPERILACHRSDEVDVCLRNLWSAGF